MADIGVVLLNYKKYELTRKCADALLALDQPLRIVIVDNCSGNDSFRNLKEHFGGNDRVDVIESARNGGYAAGNNIGIRHFFTANPQAKYVCVMNPDVEIPQGEIFVNLRQVLENNEAIAVAAGVMRYPDNSVSQICYWNIPGKWEIGLGHCVLWHPRKTNLEGSIGGIKTVEVVPGSFFMIKREAWETLGGLDEGTFLYNEENVLALQLKKLGLGEAISVNDYFIHNHPRGKRQRLIEKLRSRKVGNQSRRYLCRKYYGLLSRLLLEMVILLNYGIITLKHLAGNVRRSLRGEKV